MAAHRVPTPLRTRIVRSAVLFAGVVAAAGLGVAGPAVAAPNGNANGFLVLTAPPAAAVALPPGKAVKAAVAACQAKGLIPAATTVAAVRAVFPAPFVVCTGVTLTSKVAAGA